MTALNPTRILRILYILLLTATLSHAQEPKESYETLWEKVLQFENGALTKSALEQVQKISEKAKSENNSAQTVKALLYASKYALTLEEDAQLNIISNFKSEIKKAEFPTKNILESYLANLYWQYFQQNRYQFYDRSKTKTKVDSVDFRTWDLTTLFHEISDRFEASLENKDGLQKTNLEAFKSILRKRSFSEIYRPTLFDVLAHTALDFYKTNETSITRPAYKFEIDDPDLLCGAYAFTQLEIDLQDLTSTQPKALKLYQELIKFHFSDATLDALIDIDIERLNYLYQNAVIPNKESVYLKVLQSAAEDFNEHEVSGLYTYEIAQLYVEQGSTYDPNTNENHRFKPKEALDLCESVMVKFPGSQGAKKCRALKSRIEAVQLQLTTEKYIPVQKDARLLVQYKNTERLDFRAFKVSESQLQQLNKLYSKSDQLEFLEKLSLAKTWEAPLKNEKDYQQHSIEVPLPALANGQYVILAKPIQKDSTASETQSFAFSIVQVTDLALVTHQLSKTFQFQVIARADGRPISDAKVQMTYRKNSEQKYSKKLLNSDKNGMVSLHLPEAYWRDISIKVSDTNDTAHFEGFYISNSYVSDNQNTVVNSCFLFSDRSIYRPGQTVFFKGILMETSEEKSKVITERTVLVQLNDANGQKVSELELKTNTFGSFTGEFILPNSGLTGEFSIRVDAMSGLVREDHYFSVEEYKRPKFETRFEPVTESYRVNDSISIKGTATAYAGSAITAAKVSYRVQRAVYYPRWYYWSHPYSNTAPQEIAFGETVTDASGNYKVDFKAIPINGLSKENLPTFQYEITADVTDINGETHSATTVISVGYHALTVDIKVPERLNKTEKSHAITIATTNLNDQPVDARGTLKMYKLKAPDEVVRQRPWATPDYKYWNAAEFKNRYPNEAFSTEDDPQTWDKGKMVWQSNFDTAVASEIALPTSKKWESGIYVIALRTTDVFGEEVKALAQTVVYSDTDRKLADRQLFEISSDKSSYEVGDTADVQLASTCENLNVTVFIEKDKKIADTKIIKLNANKKSFSIPIGKEDLGGFVVKYSYSAYNAFHSGTLTISVPYPKTDLVIETATFRDKLTPGTDETWSFTIKGADGDKVSAEVLASMYDASLDAFRDHDWQFDPLIRPTYYSQMYTEASRSFGVNPFKSYVHNNVDNFRYRSYDVFNRFGLLFGYRYFGNRRSKAINRLAEPEMMTMNMESDGLPLKEMAMTTSTDSAEVLAGSAAGLEGKKESKKDSDFEQLLIRKNLQETAFFFPQLKTDEKGNVTFNFNTPEALTRWKLQLLAHTKTLKSAISTLESVTQKEVMVIPNVPRFLREGDEITLSTKIANLTGKTLSGEAKLVLTDAVTNSDISERLVRSSPYSGRGGADDISKSFEVDSMGNTQVSWRLKIPDGLQAVQYKIVAKAGNFSDGEQNLLPVLSNRKLVTETLPMWVRGDQTKTFTLDKLKNNTSSSIKNHKLTFEVTSNPAWYAVQALPYLMEYPHECNEQTFARYYANVLSSHIANSNPRIQDVFKQWANSDALIGTLEKNEEIKSLLIQETPWLRNARSEAEQKKRIALLFNLDKMKNEQANAFTKLRSNQNNSGAWSWFQGGPDNRYITQHVVAGLGHLEKLTSDSDRTDASKNELKRSTSKVERSRSTSQTERSRSTSEAERSRSPELHEMLQRAIAYLDQEFITEYDAMIRRASDMEDDQLSQTQVHYLYMRSFFQEIESSKKLIEITSYYKKQAQKYWPKKELFSQGMLALVLHRMNDTKTATNILRSLTENSITSDELGMYWKANTPSWHRYKAPIETQALMIEAFDEIQNDTKTIDNLKVWLLKNKQTNQWSTTKATTEAVYALLLQGSEWLSVTDAVDVAIGGAPIEPSQLDAVKVEAGTGYYKTAWNTAEIKPKMAQVRLSKKGKGIAWGALYWQYFEDLDKITSAETPLKLKKKLFVKKNTSTGEEISEITEGTNLKVGDLVRVRIELRADRTMEFIHMKDMRGAGFEPINVLSQYKWRHGLGYYESTKDASTNFFFDYLPKGVYIFEYDLRVNNVGEFSNGITTIQSMYAPEFSSHSEGMRVVVAE